ncbi:MAG TPA: DUF4097 family beta strand repeat-containing protein [Clostridia bacterium]|nr:DUF4097 family beta strand repeat-containing protein [Clostridia bacterium]
MEEKMLILKMLQEGKITTDEAVKLLEALEKGSANTAPSGSRINEIKDELAAKLNEMKIDEKLNKFGEKATKFAETLGEKAGKLAGQLGENINTDKIGNNTEKFTEEFAKRMESLGQDIAESATKFADTFATQFGSLFEAGYEKYRYSSSYTYPLEESASIFFRTSSFSIKTTPSDAKEITVNIYANSNMPQLVIDEYFKLITEAGNYRLSTEFPGRTWGRIEIQLPKGMDTLSISTENAKCEISGMEVKFLNCSTTNGRVIISGCNAEEIEVLADNEKVIMDKVSARTANIRTSNSRITIEDSSLDNIDAKTSNAAIQVSTSRKGDSLSSNYILNTTNGKIAVELKTSEGFEHMVDAHTTMSGIDVKLANLVFAMDKKSIGMQSTAQVRSENFDTASSKVTIKANTSNAPISIENI